MVQPANKRLVTEATVASHVAAQVTTPGTATATALSATIGEQVSEAVAPLATSADLDAVAALIGTGGGNVIASSDPNKTLTPGQVQLVVAATAPTSIMEFGQPLVWFDAQKQTEADAAAVNTLRDYSGYVSSGTLNGGRTAPVMAAAGINSKKAVKFTGASQFTSTFLAPETGGMTVVFAGQVDAATAGVGYTICDGITGTGDRIGITVSDTQLLQFSRGALVSTPAGVMPSIACVLIASFKADGAVDVWVNGIKTVVAPSAGMSTLTGVQFGGRYTGTNIMTGHLGNFGILPKVFTDAEAASLTTMLKTYWGIA